MVFVSVADVLSGKISGETSVRGWINNSRSSGGIMFILLRDGSGLLQCTVRREAIENELYRTLENLPLESALELSGMIREDGRAPGGWELSVSGTGAIYPAKADYPLVKKEHGVKFLAGIFMLETLGYRTSSRSGQSLWRLPGTGSEIRATPRPRAPAL